MHKAIIENVSNDEFKKIIESSYSINEASKKMGFKHDPGLKSRKKIEQRMKELNVVLKEKDEYIEPEKESQYKNTKEIGFVGEKAFEFLCAKNKITIYKEPSENKPHDYLLLINDKYFRVQVKTVEFIKNGSSLFHIHQGNFYYSSNKHEKQSSYNSKDIDLLFLYNIELSEAYLVEVDKTKEYIERSITIRKEKSRNNQISNCKFSEDYLFEKIIKTLDSE